MIELLFVWTKEFGGTESKIVEAYNMLKTQGLVKEDPVYVGEAVFASALPPRKQSAPLNEEQTKQLKRLLQSTNADDLQQANKIIKGMVKDDERRMDALAKRSTDLVMVNNNSKLLNEMLDHYDPSSSGREERELVDELFSSCEKMQPKLFRMASETAEDDSDDGGIADILAASDELSRVIERYKLVILKKKPDVYKPRAATLSTGSEELLDLGQGPQVAASASVAATVAAAEPPAASNSSGGLDDDILGLNLEHNGAAAKPALSSSAAPLPELTAVPSASSLPPSIDDLLNGSPIKSSAPSLLTSTLPSSIPAKGVDAEKNAYGIRLEEQKTSRQRGLEELDSLGEAAIQSVLSGTSRSPQFKKKEKLSLSDMQKQKVVTDLGLKGPATTDLTSSLVAMKTSGDNGATPAPVQPAPNDILPSAAPPQAAQPTPKAPDSVASPSPAAEVKLSDLEVPLSSIRPSSTTPPMELPTDTEGLSIVLHFGQDKPRENVSAVVVTVSNKTASELTDFELKAVVPKGCRVKLCPPSATSLAALASPFLPPATITQVMLIANPGGAADVCLKYVLSYCQDGEPQTELGQVASLPI